MGAEVFGPCPSIEQGAGLIDNHQPDAAVLDYLLGGFPCLALTARLAEMAIPFVIVTGFPREALPDHLRGADYVAEPFAREELFDALIQEMGLTVRLGDET